LFVIRVIPSNITIESQAPYQMITMSWPQYGSFDGWRCITDTNQQCMIAIPSTSDSMTVLSPYHTTLQGQLVWWDQTELTITNQQGQSVWILRFNFILP
jgi:hypothetical protein